MAKEAMKEEEAEEDVEEDVKAGRSDDQSVQDNAIEENFDLFGNDHDVDDHRQDHDDDDTFKDEGSRITSNGDVATEFEGRVDDDAAAVAAEDPTPTHLPSSSKRAIVIAIILPVCLTIVATVVAVIIACYKWRSNRRLNVLRDGKSRSDDVEGK